MTNSKSWTIAITLCLTACPAAETENDTLFSTLTATDTDASGTSPSSTTTAPTSGTEESSTSADAESESGSPGTCGGGICAQPPPDGWFGPIVRWDDDGSEPPLCADGWPDAAFTLLSGYTDPGPAECTCSCGISIGSLCYSYAYVNQGNDTCSDYSMMMTPSMPCNEVSIDSGSLYMYAYTQGTPSCQSDVERIIPEPTWDLEVRGCRGAEMGEACDEQGRMCLPKAPAGFEDWLCIFSEGDLECPAGDYSEKSLLYSGVADTRSCGPCVCDAAPSASCTGQFEVFDTDDCTSDPIHTQPLSSFTCSGHLENVASMRIALDGGTECPIFTDTTPTGSIEPDGAITYCCMPR